MLIKEFAVGSTQLQASTALSCCSMTYVCTYTKYNPFLFSVEGGTGRHSSKQAIQSGTGGGGRQG